MKRIKILRRIMRQTGAGKIWSGFLVFFLGCAVAIWILEPTITDLGDALWYCYAVVTTIGFGDVTVISPLARALSVLLSIYAALVIAIVTGVVVNFFNQIVALRQKETLTALTDKLERLPELSVEELEWISRKVREFHEDMK